ncbi:MAG: tetratricopeptide repeat protein [Candidatus Aminicenantes bacterium]|jgi:Tol biopolymer transport system component
MKKKSIEKVFLIVFLGICLSIVGISQRTEDPGVMFRAAIEKEEVDGDLMGAINLYKKIIVKFGSNQTIAAKAQLRIGICYEKLGQKNIKLAQEAFQKVIDNYPTQSEEVKIAKEKLSFLLKVKERLEKSAIEHKVTKIYESTEKSYGFISPDGKKLALVGGKGDVWLRKIASGEEIRLTRTPSFKYWCFWSPDSKTIAYLDVLNGLYIVHIKGGESKALIESDSDFIREGNYAWPTGWTSDSKTILCQVSKRGLCAIPVSGEKWKDIFRYPDQKTEEDFSFLTLSPDGKFLAYEAHNDIYLMPVNGGKSIQVTNHPFPDSWPVWSFDGQWISFNSARSGSSEIWVIRISPDGHPEGEPIQVSRGLTLRNTFYNWVKGEKIGISMNRGGSNIFVNDLETGKETRLTNIIAQERNPRWSPDGRQIAFIRDGGDLWMIPTGRGEAKKLTINVPNPNENRYITRPSWLPDGEKLIFGGFFGYDNRGIWIVPVEGEVPQKLGFGFNMGVECCDVSPDGAYIAFDYIGAKKRKIIEGSRTFEKDIYVMPFKGGAPQRITKIEKSGLAFRCPRWSPDGKRLAFRSIDWFADHEGKEPEEVWVCEFPEGEPRSITKKMKGNLTHLSWSPGGKTIVFSKVEQSKEQIFAVPSDGGEIKKMNIEGFSPDFSPDGTKIAYGKRTQRKVEFWLVENFLPTKKEKK